MAMERFLACMYTFMYFEKELIGKWLLAELTVKEVPSVDTVVVSQIDFLRETFTAYFTRIWFLSGVCSKMKFEITLLTEGLWTKGTLKRFLP